MNWPNDADGDVLRRLEASGFDFNKEYEIDFNIDFNAWPISKEVMEVIGQLYPNNKTIDPDKESIENGNTVGYVQFQIFGKITYELVVNTQEFVTKKMQPYGGWCESWGVWQG